MSNFKQSSQNLVCCRSSDFYFMRSHNYVTGFGKTRRMGFFVKIEFDVFDKLYYRANYLPSLKQIARFA